MDRRAQLELLRAQIDIARYDMSVGEWIVLYKNNEIDIHPELQKHNCWNNSQKTRFIELLLLGIPQKPILVMQRPDGVWDIYDGLEELSTIFQFMGLLKDACGQPVEPFVLENTTYLPALEGKSWDLPEEPKHSFNSAEIFYLKGANLPAKIIMEMAYRLMAPNWFQQPVVRLPEFSH